LPLFATIALLLAFTIPFTMPTNELQLGRVVVSELSPYLVGLGAVTAALSILWLRRARASAGKLTVLALVESSSRSASVVPLGLREELVRATCERFLGSVLR